MTDDSDAKSPDGLHESWHGLSREERRRLTAQNKNDWLEFPGLSGTHLSWRRRNPAVGNCYLIPVRSGRPGAGTR